MTDSTGAPGTDADLGGFTPEERAAMKARAAEARSEKGGSKKAERERQALLDAIAAMPDGDRVLAERIHALISDAAPELAPKTWYGMPAYALDGAVLCFFQAAAKFNARYATFGFNDVAKLDDGTMWPTSFALTRLTADDETRIVELVKRAVG